MGDQLDDDRDEEWFKQVYGTEYTGPPRASSAPAPAPAAVAGGPAAKGGSKRLPTAVSDSEEDEGPPHDPNAVPTDFTSREAKVWEAKAKAVERNWKRRKEEELTCRLCGEAGHFAQVSEECCCGCCCSSSSSSSLSSLSSCFLFKLHRQRPPT